MAGATQNDALLFKNEAAIKKTEGSDQWNFYQAKSSKQNRAELGATLTLIQIAIAPAAITILTRQKPMGLGALGVAIASIALGLMAAAHI